MLVCTISCAGVMAQTESQPQADDDETATATLSEERVRSQLAAVESSPDLSAEAKVEAANYYKQALEQVAQTASWRSKSEEYRQGIADTPKRRESSRDQLEETTAKAENSVKRVVSADDTLEDLVPELTNAEGELKTRQDALSKLEEEAEQRGARRSSIADLIAAATARVESADQGLTEVSEGKSPMVQQARRTLLQSQRSAAKEEISSYQLELQYYDARREVLSLRQELARAQLSIAEAEVNELKQLVSQRREQEAELQRKKVIQELKQASPEIVELAELNNVLSKELSKLGDQIKTAQSQAKHTSDMSADLTLKYDRLKQFEANPEMADLLGQVMQQRRSELRAIGSPDLALEQNQKDYARVRFRLLEIDEEMQKLLNIDQSVTAQLESIKTEELHSDQVASLRADLTSLMSTRKETLDKLRRDYAQYSTDLIDLRVALGNLRVKLTQLNEFIAERFFWIPSTNPIHEMAFPLEWTTYRDGFATLFTVWRRDAAIHAWSHGFAALPFVLLIGMQRWLRKRIREAGECVSNPRTDRYALTIRTLMYTLAIALPVPLLICIGGARVGQLDVSANTAAYELTRALRDALLFGGVVLFVSALLRQTCRADGLATRHFRWDVTGCRVVRTSLTWFTPIVVPLSMVVVAAESIRDPAWGSSIGRIAFIAAMLLTLILAWLTFHPRKGAVAKYYQRKPGSILSRLRTYVLLVAMMLPLTAGIASACGYHFTAGIVSLAIAKMAGLSIALLVAHAMAVRAVFYAQRRLALEEAERTRAERAASEEAGGAAEATVDVTDLNIGAIGAQTKQLLSNFAWFGALVVVWLSWSELLPALSFLDDVSLWSYTKVIAADTTGAAGETLTETVVQNITLANLLVAALAALFTLALARNIPGLMEILFLRRMVTDAATRFAIATVTRYIITVMGVAAACGAIGISWSSVQWLVAAITVGLGFGLQEIFANFMSGLILLFERPLRIGDTVTVGEVSGTVTRMRIRATTITDWDRKELVIPNREFVTGHFINWTLSDPTLRVLIKVGIAYGSDVAKAKSLLQRVADEEERVLDEPKPQVLFLGFGDSALNFELRVFIRQVDDLLYVRDKMHTEIDAAFREAKIEIAFPQRDIHIRSIQASLPVEDARETPS